MRLFFKEEVERGPDLSPYYAGYEYDVDEKKAEELLEKYPDKIVLLDTTTLLLDILFKLPFLFEKLMKLFPTGRLLQMDVAMDICNLLLSLERVSDEVRGKEIENSFQKESANG